MTANSGVEAWMAKVLICCNNTEHKNCFVLVFHGITVRSEEAKKPIPVAADNATVAEIRELIRSA